MANIILLCAKKKINSESLESLFQTISKIKDEKEDIRLIFESEKYIEDENINTYMTLNKRFKKIYTLNAFTAEDGIEDYLSKNINYPNIIYLLNATSEFIKETNEKYPTAKIKVFTEKDGKLICSDISDVINPPIQDNNNSFERKSSKKSPKKKTIIFCSILASVTIILCGGIFIMRKDNGQEIEQQNTQISEKESQIAFDKEKSEEIYNEYISENITYKEAVDAIEALSTYDKDKVDAINKIQSSRNFYQQAKAEAENGAYKKAIADFQKVISLDETYYKLAQSEIALCIANYKTSEKQQAEEIAKTEDYKSAYDKLESLKNEFKDDTFLNDECISMQIKYIKTWIENQAASNKYFTENGAVMLAYSYSCLDENSVNDIINQGIQYEKQSLLNKLNGKRTEFGKDALTENSYLSTMADNYAVLFGSNRVSEINVNYNTHGFIADSADTAMESAYLDLDVGEFFDSSKSIGIGIFFNTTNLTCYWYVLTASETDISK